MLACPICAERLVPTLVGSVELDICGSCECVFFDGGELAKHLTTGAKVENALREAAKHGGPSVAGPCPKCAGAFASVDTASGPVQMCAGCDGVVLPAGVFARAKAHGVLPRGLARMAIARGTRTSRTAVGDGAAIAAEAGLEATWLAAEVGIAAIGEMDRFDVLDAGDMVEVAGELAGGVLSFLGDCIGAVFEAL